MKLNVRKFVTGDEEFNKLYQTDALFHAYIETIINSNFSEKHFIRAIAELCEDRKNINDELVLYRMKYGAII